MQRLQQAGPDLRMRIDQRFAEVEEAVLSRVYALSDADSIADSEYLAGLRVAVSAAIDYALAAIEVAGGPLPPVPGSLLMQARLAARKGVPLDIVLRRYLAGYMILMDFVIEEVVGGELAAPDEARRLLRMQAPAFDRILGAVADEYGRAREEWIESPARRRVEQVRRLLGGELLDLPELEYGFRGHHVGVVASGAACGETLASIARACDRRLLLVNPEDQTAWAWIGGRKAFSSGELERLETANWSGEATVGIGEPSEGIAGWRLTHRQAGAVQTILLRRRERVSRYAKVALLACVVSDDLFATSLRKIYLRPLAAERDGGATLRETLRSYCAAEGNISSAAAALGVSRQTVAKRLRATEERVGHPLRECLTEIDAALRLESFEQAVRSVGTQTKDL